MGRKYQSIFIAAFLLLFIHFHAFSINTLNSYGKLIPQKTIGINPGLIVPLFPAGLNTDITVFYGINERMDISAALFKAVVYPYFKYWGFQAMFRYDLDFNNILGIKTGYSSAGFLVSPQYHFIWDIEWFNLILNVYSDLNFSKIFSAGLGANIAPVLWIGWFGIVLEADLLYSIIGTGNVSIYAFNIKLAPGMIFNFGNSGYIITGFEMDNIINTYPSFAIGIKYCLPLPI